jgi:hypothetical protein
MKTAKKTTAATGADVAFSSFLFAIVGWALREVRHVQTGAGWRSHVVTTALGLLICAIALRRYKRLWTAEITVGQLVDGLRLELREAPKWIALLFIGAVFTMFVKAGSFFILSIYLTAVGFAPWSKLSLCRRHFVLSSLVIAIGAASTLFLGRLPVDPSLLPLSALFFWAIATALLMMPDGKPVETTVKVRANQRDKHADSVV